MCRWLQSTVDYWMLTCSPTATCSPKTEPKVIVICSAKTESKVVKNFKGKQSIPIKICLSKNDNIQIHQFIEMLRDLNPSTCSSLVIFKARPWSSGTCIGFDAGRSWVRLSAGCHQDLANGTVAFLPRAWCAEELQGTHPEHKNKTSEMEPEIVLTLLWGCRGPL